MNRIVWGQVLNSWIAVSENAKGRGQWSRLMAIFRIEVFLTTVATLVSSSAYAATVPDAGSLRQQIEQNQQPNIPHKDLQEKLPEPATTDEQKGVIVTVKSFRFAGNTLLTNEQLAASVNGYLNRPIDFTELQAAVAAVAKVYRDAGWIVRAYLPRQDITNGAVTIRIVEAIFGGVRLEGQPASRVKLNKVLSIINAQQKQEALLNADALDRGLLLADDLPGVAVSGSLHEGEKSKETDLLIKLADEPLLYGDLGVDNTGSRSTGANRATANFNLNSPMGMGDLTSANLMHTQGSDYLRLDESLPVGSDGWRAGVNSSYLKYALVAPEFTALNAMGTSDTYGLEASYPLIRSRMKNVYFSANLDNKNFDNQASGATTTKYTDNTATVGLSGNLFDNIGGGGANSASLSFIDGILDLNNSPNQAADAAAAQTAGRYDKLRYSASRQQVITENWSFFSAVSGQRANKNLNSSEMFYLGGASGVRAYPASEGGGADGDLLNLELRRQLPYGFTFVGFYDYGQITINKNNSFTGASALNEYSLKGAGLSLAWQAASGFNIKATYSRRIGDNPNPTLAGADQDGSFVRDRLWLVANMPFSANGSRSAASSAEVTPVATVTTEQVNAGNTATSIPPAAKDSEKTPEVEASTNATAAAAAKNDTGINLTGNAQRTASTLIETEQFIIRSTRMLRGSAVRLVPVVKYAQAHSDDLVEIDGYADTHLNSTHSAFQYQYNLNLSQQRAVVVKNYLEKLGIKASRMTTKGFSYENPIASNETQAGRDENRRAEIRFMSKKTHVSDVDSQKE